MCFSLSPPPQFNLSLSLLSSAFSETSPGEIQTHNATLNPRMCVCWFHSLNSIRASVFSYFLSRRKQHKNLSKSTQPHYAYLLTTTTEKNTTERRRIEKRIRPWVEVGIRRIKRWIWRWIWFPQATPRRLTQVEYEWGKRESVCVCVRRAGG